MNRTSPDEVNPMLGRDMEERPRFLRDVVSVPLDTGVLIDGLGHIEVMRGSLALTILPMLVRLLDGTRSISDLEKAFPLISPDYIRSALQILKEWRLIEPVDHHLAPANGNANTLSFLRRQIASSLLDGSAANAYGRLQKATVLIVAAEAAINQAECLQNLLQATGLGHVYLVTQDQVRSNVIPEQSLILALSFPDSSSWYKELCARSTSRSYSWMYAAIDTELRQADIGPVFRPDDECCYPCFQNTHTHSVNGLLGPRPTIYEEHIWLSMLALEVTYFFALPTLGLWGRQFKRYVLPHWQSRTLIYPRLPGCQFCRREPLCAIDVRSDGTVGAHMTDTALVFEEYVGLDSRATLSFAARGSFAQIQNALSEEATERFQNSEQIPLHRGTLNADLAALEAMREPNKAPTYALTLDRIAGILAITAGIREISQKAIRRWPATAGNLGSVELFLVSRAIDGLNPGFYHYDPRKHVLASLKKRAGVEPCNFMHRVLGRSDDDLPDALILLTGNFGLLSKKYGSFAYRLVNFDAGAALSQLHLIARSTGLRARTVSSAADDLIQEQLYLDASNEQFSAVVEVSRATRKSPQPAQPGHETRDRPKSPCSWKAASEFAGLDQEQITGILREESCVREADPSLGPRAIPSELLPQNRRSDITIKLPKPARGGFSVQDILAARRSTRAYSEVPVAVGDIGTALHCAFTTDKTAWPAEFRHGCPLNYYVLPRRVSGIDPAVYTYGGERHVLLKVRSPLSHEETVDLLVQDEFAEAPVLIWITGNLAAACAENGAKGHRHLLLRAGTAAHRLWMAGLALGLSGTIVAGLIPGAGRRLLGIDGYKTASLIACALGYRKG